MAQQIEERIEEGITTDARVEESRRSLDMDVSEHAKFQTLKSEAVLQKIISAAEGQLLYALLGESVAVFNDQNTAVKSVLTGFFAELLHIRIASRHPENLIEENVS